MGSPHSTCKFRRLAVMAKLLKLEIVDLSSAIELDDPFFVEVGNLLRLMGLYESSFVYVLVMEDEGVELQDAHGEPFGFLPLRRAS